MQFDNRKIFSAPGLWTKYIERFYFCCSTTNNIIKFYTVPHESPKKELKIVHGDTELENFSVHWYRECNSSGIRTDNNEKLGREVFS